MKPIRYLSVLMVLLCQKQKHYEKNTQNVFDVFKGTDLELNPEISKYLLILRHQNVAQNDKDVA
jgi:hypothetical protein